MVCRVKIHTVCLACCGAYAAVGRGIGVGAAEQIFYLAVECGRVGVVLCDGLERIGHAAEIIVVIVGNALHPRLIHIVFNTHRGSKLGGRFRAAYEIRVGRYALDLLRFNICKADCGQQDDNYGCNGCDNI